MLHQILQSLIGLEKEYERSIENHKLKGSQEKDK